MVSETQVIAEGASGDVEISSSPGNASAKTPADAKNSVGPRDPSGTTPDSMQVSVSLEDVEKPLGRGNNSAKTPEDVGDAQIPPGPCDVVGTAPDGVDTRQVPVSRGDAEHPLVPSKTPTEVGVSDASLRRGICEGSEDARGDSAKRPKMSLEEVEWTCCFPHGQAVKDFMENINNVTAEGCFVFSRTESFSGILTDSIDSSKIALVQGRLTAEVTSREGCVEDTFCVHMKDLICCLRNAHAQHFLKLWRPKGSSDLVLHVFEPDNNTFNPTFRIKTLDRTMDSVVLDTMEYSLIVEIELLSFRNAIKTAKARFNGEGLR